MPKPSKTYYLLHVIIFIFPSLLHRFPPDGVFPFWHTRIMWETKHWSLLPAFKGNRIKWKIKHWFPGALSLGVSRCSDRAPSKSKRTSTLLWSCDGALFSISPHCEHQGQLEAEGSDFPSPHWSELLVQHNASVPVLHLLSHSEQLREHVSTHSHLPLLWQVIRHSVNPSIYMIYVPTCVQPQVVFHWILTTPIFLPDENILLQWYNPFPLVKPALKSLWGYLSFRSTGQNRKPRQARTEGQSRSHWQGRPTRTKGFKG